MALQTIFQAGNSSVVAIPKDLLKEINLKVGQTVTVERMPNTNDLIIKTTEKDKPVKSGVRKEFKKWLNKFITEEKDLLIELSHR